MARNIVASYSTAPSRNVSPSAGDEALQAIVGMSAAMSAVRAWIARVASSRITVLITGETGTGKELVAAAIHRASPRATNRFLCLNCAALPEALVESELFGHERGAFTGASEARAGLLRSCDGGTLFLDEVGDLSLPSQAKLLRVIESKQVPRLGDSRCSPVDLRIVAATNRDLEALVGEGVFRKDLFYRLNVARIHVPPLRERAEDVPALVTACLRVLNREFGAAIERVSDDAMQRLMHHTWPGNVRELRNILETACVTCTGHEIASSDLPSYLRPAAAPSTPAHAGATERDRLLSALVSVQWNKSRAAVLLNWSRMTVYRKLARYGLTDAASQPTAVADLTVTPLD